MSFQAGMLPAVLGYIPGPVAQRPARPAAGKMHSIGLPGTAHPEMPVEKRQHSQKVHTIAPLGREYWEPRKLLRAAMKRRSQLPHSAREVLFQHEDGLERARFLLAE